MRGLEETSMATYPTGSWRAAARSMFLALATGLLLVACGGGGGGDDTPAAPALEGTWRLSLTQSGSTSTGGTVPGSSVPSQQQVAAINTASFAQLLGSSSYQGYTVTLNASTITITGAGTNLAIVVNSLSTSNYRGCGTSCGVGKTVAYDMSVNLTVSGTLNGVVQSGSGAGVVTVTYTRVS